MNLLNLLHRTVREGLRKYFMINLISPIYCAGVPAVRQAVIPILTVVAALVVIWYGAAVALNSWAYNKAAQILS